MKFAAPVLLARASLLTDIPSHLTRLASKHCTLLTLFPVYHTEEKPAGENLSKVRLYGKGTDESREIFPEFVEISSRQNLHSFAALGKLIILTAE